MLQPAIRLESGDDGAIAPDGYSLGTYVHGLFDRKEVCAALLRWSELAEPSVLDYEALHEAGIERMADAIEQHLDWRELDRIFT